ncbi:MAG TPA: hypothetical protein VI541_03455 [Actinomycetota bacterium]|nr:hypothetical protein [Actinomycetota bacterium]
MGEDEDLLKRAEEVLTQIDREHGLDDEHLEFLAALRIRIFGAPRKTLDDVMKAAGEMKGRKLEEIEPPRKTTSLEDVLRKEPPPKEWPGVE